MFPPEESWLDRLRSHGAERDAAIHELRGILVKGLSRALPHRYGGEAVIEDVAQEALLRILHSLDTFAGRSRFTTWAMAIATRVGISELRKSHYRQVSLDSLNEDDSLRFEVPSPQEDPSANDQGWLFQMLKESIDEDLTARQKLAVRASLEGLPIEEIACRMNSNRNAIYKLVHDARLKLRASLEARGVTFADLDYSQG